MYFHTWVLVINSEKSFHSGVAEMMVLSILLAGMQRFVGERGRSGRVSGPRLHEGAALGSCFVINLVSEQLCWRSSSDCSQLMNETAFFYLI